MQSANVTENKDVKEQTKTNKRQCPVSPVQVKKSIKAVEMEPETWMKGFVEQIGFRPKTGVKG